MTSRIEYVMQQGQVDWIKLDYNINVGNEIDSTDPHVKNTRLYNHLQGYYGWLDDIAKKYPNLVIENYQAVPIGPISESSATLTLVGFRTLRIRVFRTVGLVLTR